MGYLPIPTPPSAKQIASRAVADLARSKAERERAALLAREPWRDPSSDCYDPLRVLLATPPAKLRRAICRAAPLLIVLTLTACATPQVQYITRPVYIDRVQQVVKPIDPELLQLHPIAEGLPSQCPIIAVQRRTELEKCNADKAAITAITGIAGAKGQGDE